jgi:hypothetical protein|nr:MAG TPA: hypothetical protein [Caudoviricetes sp.]
MRKIKTKKEEYEDNGPDLYERYFEKYNLNSKDTIIISKDTMNKFLVKNTSYKDGIGDLISKSDRLDVLIEDRIINNNRKKF